MRRWKRTSWMLVCLLAGMASCMEQGREGGGGQEAGPAAWSDLAEIERGGKLVALMENSSTSYFIYKARPMGFEFDLLKRFAAHIGVELEVRVASDLDHVLSQLNAGEADIVAANLTVTRDRKRIVEFTTHHLLTRQVLVQRKPVNWHTMNHRDIERHLLRNPIDLSGKFVHVRRNSSFYTRLVSLSEEIGGRINIVEVPGEMATEELIAQVADGEIHFTVADENVAMVNSTYYPELDVGTPISFHQRIAWAVRKNSPALLRELNRWLHAERKKPSYLALYRKYFLDAKMSAERMSSEYSSLSGGKISAYDDLIRKHSKTIGWDWRLLAAQIYQESHFNPDARSWAGAYGLMQLMPSTVKRLGYDTITSPAQSMEAAVRFIAWLDKFWLERVPDEEERIRFILASYNVGLGHVIDARSLAEKYGRDAGRWTGHVDLFLRRKSSPKYYRDPVVKYGYCRGEEPYQYVRSILNRYEHYRNVIDSEEGPEPKPRIVRAG